MRSLSAQLSLLVASRVLGLEGELEESRSAASGPGSATRRADHAPLDLLREPVEPPVPIPCGPTVLNETTVRRVHQAPGHTFAAGRILDPGFAPVELLRDESKDVMS